MKKHYKYLSLLFITLLFVTPFVYAQDIHGPSTVTQDAIFNNNNGLKASCYMLGLDWVFYPNITDSNHIYYKTSTDAITWSTPTLVSVMTNPDIGIEALIGDCLSTSVMLVYDNSSLSSYSKALYSEGTLQSNGTVSWNIKDEFIATIDPYSQIVGFTRDSNNLPWITISNSTITQSFDVYQRSAGIWNNMLHVDNTVLPLITSLSSGKIGLEYLDILSSTFQITTYNGATWNPTIDIGANTTFAITSKADTMYLVLTDDNDTIAFAKFNYGDTSLSGFTIVGSTYPNYVIDGAISAEQTSGNILISYTEQGDTIEYTYSRSNGLMWSPDFILSSSEFFPNKIGQNQFMFFNGTVSVTWEYAPEEQGTDALRYSRIVMGETTTTTTTSTTTTTTTTTTRTNTTTTRTGECCPTDWNPILFVLVFCISALFTILTFVPLGEDFNKDIKDYGFNLGLLPAILRIAFFPLVSAVCWGLLSIITLSLTYQFSVPLAIFFMLLAAVMVILAFSVIFTVSGTIMTATASRKQGGD